MSGRARGLWPAAQRLALWLASGPYGMAVQLRNGLYDRGWKQSYRAQVPVVSVGNLTVGGTGKTPCVEYVARRYRKQDLRVAILSRGYGSRGGPNDEALVLEKNLSDVPHLQGADRAALATIAVEELESEILVLDDGFQHRRLQRDLDIVLLDATQPWGHGNLLPRGLLREPRRNLRRAGIVLLTRCDQVASSEMDALRHEVGRLAPDVPLAESNHGPLEWVNEATMAPLSLTNGRPVVAFCGLGNPEGFRGTLRKLDIEPVEFRTYPDHHAYSRNDVEELVNWARKQARDCVVVTTQKDLVKLRLPRLGDRELWALRIGLEFRAGQDAFDQKLLSVIHPRS